MKRYIVTGWFCEHVAHFHCLADSETEAVEKWDTAFPDCSREVFRPTAGCVEDSPLLEDLWKGDGWRRVSVSRGRVPVSGL